MSSGGIVEGLSICPLSLAETAALVCHNAGSEAAQNVFTLNLDHVVKMRKSATFRAAYGRAGLVTADGFPIVLACSAKAPLAVLPLPEVLATRAERPKAVLSSPVLACSA